MNRIYTVKDSAISTRNQAEMIVGEADKSGCKKLDLSEVEFMSRSSADELRVQADRKDLEIIGKTGDVKGMFEVIRSHREDVTA